MYLPFIRYCGLAFLCTIYGFDLHAQISGIVYRDYNSNGFRDSSLLYLEPGVGEVQVFVTGFQGTTNLTLTDDTGHFTIQPTDDPPYRLEFRQIKKFDYPGPMISNNSAQGSAIQFFYERTGSTSYGINYPGDYCLDPQIVTPCYVMGDPLDTNSAFKNFDAFVSFDYHAGGTSLNSSSQIKDGGTAPDVHHLAVGKEIGSCWGTAVLRSSGKILTSATLKRHSGIGPLSFGGLYEIDPALNKVRPLLDLNSIGVPSGHLLTNSQRNLPIAAPPVSTDSLAYSYIGKLSYGAMDVSEDERYLYIMGLYTRKLYSIHLNRPFELPNAADVDSFSIPDPACTNGTYRPWAVKVHRGKVYVGVVCDASIGGTANDLHAFVYEFDPTTKLFSNILEFPLDYPAYSNKFNFNPWKDEWNGDCPDAGNIFCQYPQPILSDIEFDGDDVMILGIMDRYSLQGGINQHDLEGHGIHTIISYGDMLRARYNPGFSKFILENNGNDGKFETAGRNTGFGPGGGEYYYGDHSISINGLVSERESLNGAISRCPGFGDVVSAAVDPIGQYTSGVIHLNNLSGNWEKRYNIISHDFGLLIGKGNALGDLKILSKSAPIEIGNYIWSDRNGNGIQDPTEAPLPGVRIELLKNDSVIASSISNENGYYLFSNQNCPALNPSPQSFIYDVNLLAAESDYRLRIPGFASQAPLLFSNPGPKNTGTPNNDAIDSDGEIENGDIVLDLKTGMDGQNDHSFDFGFVSTLPCDLKLSDIQTSSCNPLTNGFNLDFKIHTQNGPVGKLVIELSTGESKIVDGLPNGIVDVHFKNLPTKGIAGIAITVYYLFDLHCRLYQSNAFDQPVPCCQNTFSLCSNRDALIQLLAVPGMAQYKWFDSTSRKIVGNTEMLLFDKNFTGLEDGYEAYYFEAIDSLGDTIRQHCNFRISIVECCGLQVNTFLQTDCNNNGTVNDPSDDWFAVLVSADNPQPGPSSRYEVLLNGKILGSASYGSSILVGMAPNSDFHADGITRYKVEIRDADNPVCLDSLFTNPTACPRPRITVKKNLISKNIQSDASFNIVYRIDIENSGDESGSYTLRDVPAFDDDIQLLAAFYTTNIPGKGGGALIGYGPWNIINNQLIGPGIKHSVTLTLNVKLDLRPGSGGDNVYHGCGVSESGPAAGQGLFNRALIDVDQDGIYDDIDTSCADIPYLELHKNLLNISQLDLYNYQLDYLIRVDNLGGAAGTYNLYERPTFDDDIAIQSASYSSNKGAGGLLNALIPPDGWLLGSNQNIPAGAKDSFLLRLKVNLNLDPGSQGNNIYQSCGFTNPQQSRIGEGLFNVALLDLNGDTRPERRDTTCNDLPQIFHKKQLIAQTRKPDGSIDYDYLITVHNKGGAAGSYTLKDVPSFEDDAIIRLASYQLNNQIPQSLITTPGTSGWLLAQGKILAPFSRDSFMVKLNVFLDYEKGSTGDNLYQACRKNEKGEYLAGFGLFNESTLDINADGIPDQRDTVCKDYAFYDLALKKYEITSTTVRKGDYIAYRIAVYNQGTLMPRNIRLLDYLPRIYEFNPILNSRWKVENDTLLSYVLDSLPQGDSAIIDLIVRIKAGYRNVFEVINTTEIASFDSSNSYPAEDIDSDPDNDRTNDNPVLPGNAYDDILTGHHKSNPDEDEDDHDVATALIFDLALRKEKSYPLAVGYNQNVDFRIWVYNQGNVAAQNISIVDYVPSGFRFNPADNPDWTDIGNGMVTSEIPIIIPPGDSVAKTITLELLHTSNPQNWINRAEIKNAFIVNPHHIVNILQDDFDSEHDMIMDNDMGGEISSPTDDFIWDCGTDSDGDGIKDEDDADPATAQVWDLALIKFIKTPKPHMNGQALEFVIRIYNQGTDTVGQVGIKDHIPPALKFLSNLNTQWKLDGDHADYILKRRINPGDSADVSLFLELHPAKDKKDWINYAEIVGSANLSLVDRTGQDFDSHEGSDNAYERSVVPGSLLDNDIQSDGSSGDEDDHDPAAPSILDLALCKLYYENSPAHYGDTLLFSINVFNQGTLPVKQVSLVDYIPTGLSWIPNAFWSYDPGTSTATYVLDSLLNPGDSARIFYHLRVQQYPGSVFNQVNVAEIVRAVDSEGFIYFADFDSQYDYNKNNDVGGVPNSLTDNAIDDDGLDSDGDGIKDEDDQDPAMVPIVDLALKKELVNTSTSDTACFRIYIYNQGNVPSGKVKIADYLNTAYQFIPSKNPLWSVHGSQLEYTFQKTLKQGGIDSVDLKLLALTSTISSDYYNWAEIIQVLDTLGNDISDRDADSKPASNSAGERNVKPGDPDDNNLTGGGPYVNQDEDDHDVAGYIQKAKIGNMVWHDKNGNGIQDPGEEGIKGIRIELYRSDNKSFVRAMESDVNGKYLFDNILPGKYYLKFLAPTEYSITKANINSDLSDSDADGSNGPGTTATTILESGEEDLSWDLGLYKCIPVSGYVWFDYNRDGIQQNSENGINGLFVYLYKLPGKTLYAQGKTYSNNARFLHDGYYNFCVEPGEYYLKVSKLNGFILSPALQGQDPTRDSDLNEAYGEWTSRKLSGQSGDTIPNIGAAMYNPSFSIKKADRHIALYQEDFEHTPNRNGTIQLFAEETSSSNHLNWTVAEQPCASFYRIERRTDSKKMFEFISMVSALPSELNTDVCQFTFEDRNVNQTGFYAYQVVALDEAGNRIASNVAYVERTRPHLKKLVTAFPNPAADAVTLQFANPVSGIIELRLYDGLGNEIRMYTFDMGTRLQKNELNLDLRDIPGGLYSIGLKADSLNERLALTVVK